MDSRTEAALTSLVRVGKVTAVDGYRARVKFPDMDLTSDWLPVLRTATSWAPAVGAAVLCLYEPVFNGQGYIIGGVQ